MLSRETFANPPASYRPIPFWFWNSKLRGEEIRNQIHDFHARGIGGFFIHARFGLETRYLSKEWMECIRRAVEVAEELGMQVWLYDENGFPSGVGDLKVSSIPEYRSKFVELTEIDVSGGEELDIEVPPGNVVLAYAYQSGGPSGERIDLSAGVSGNRLTWKAPRGAWSVAVYSRRVLEDPNDVVFGVDYLNPEAMQYFFALTLEPYKEALGEHFGTTIKGIFTDEPTLLPWHHDIDWYGRRSHTRVVVWSELVEREMLAQEGLTADRFLPHLFFDIDGSTGDVRRAFRRTVSRLYERAFFEPYSRWCAQNNLKLTGHVLFEEGLYLNTDFQADITRPLAHMNIPGTDHLGLVTETPYGGFSNTPRHLTNLQGEKLVTSIAHHSGREAAISETYGCAGWGLTFEQMKWIADWQYGLGINMLCPHALFYSIEGFRKSDAPPSHNHLAGWGHYRAFSDYVGRLSYMMREGVHAAKVALLYPLERFWGEHRAGVEGERDRVISDSFDLCASILPRLHFDYDILPEQTLASATVRDGRLAVGDEEYHVLIASPLSVSGQAGQVMRDFVSTGGTVILPPISRGRPEPQLVARESAPLLDLADAEPVSTGQAYAVLFSGELGSRVIVTLAGTAHPDGVADALDGALRESIDPDVEIRAADGSRLPDVRYVHRVLGPAHVYFVINTADRASEAWISLETQGEVEVWDPETGRTLAAPGVEVRDGRTVVPCDLAPFGSAFLVVETSRPVSVRPRPTAARDPVWVFGNEWRFAALDPNVLRLDEWVFRPRTHGSGGDYEYAASFECEFVPSPLWLMLDDIEYRGSLMGGMDLTIDVNGTQWHNPEFGWHVDPGFKTLDISGAVARGPNRIRLTIRHSAWSGQPSLLSSPPALLGDFTCDPERRTLLPPAEAMMTGSWTDFGYPMFSGTAVYTQSFRLPDEPPCGRMLVSIDDVRDMVEVAVNGATAGARLWRPWEVDVTDLVRRGHNLLELRVTNSMAGFLEGSPRPSGLLGSVRLTAESASQRDSL